MRKPIELNYVKKNGMLYPDLQISNDKDDDKQPIGKYGMTNLCKNGTMTDMLNYECQVS